MENVSEISSANSSNMEYVWTARESYVVGGYFIITGLIGVFGNGIVLSMFSIYKALRTPTNTLFINLAVNDIGMCLCLFPIAGISSFKRVWIFGTTGCQWYGFTGMLFGLANIGFLTAISVDRYLITCKYYIYCHLKHFHYHLIAACVWISAAVWAFFPLSGWGRYAEEAGGIACAVDWESRDHSMTTYITTIFVVCFLIPLLIISVCYARVCLFIRKLGHGTQENPEWTNQKDVTKMCAIAIICFIIAWMPYAVICLWSIYGHPDYIPNSVQILPSLFAKSSASYNPLIYVALNRRFRLAIVKMFRCNNDQRPLEEELRMKNLMC
ncbi:visual pigment-like receptor peropsin [Octopus vulgaris]|uniref:Visual pigment-like receptor peropsin n=2 Tax=Octopus TaxID=6643 RepID=A0AA36B2Q2_OCTVU|nr:visual pigment-like receptor peropsin [Octopus sinensis]CAI9726855.1 visual pigment-like receptor peropsin [Octopus vulgaris]